MRLVGKAHRSGGVSVCRKLAAKDSTKRPGAATCLPAKVRSLFKVVPLYLDNILIFKTERSSRQVIQIR